MKVNDLIAHLKEHGIETTAAEIKARLGSVAGIQDADIPSVVEVWHEVKPTGAIAKADRSNITPSGKSSVPAPAPAPGAPLSVSRIDSDQYQQNIAAQFAQPLIDANAKLDALEQGMAGAAAHLHGRKQQIMDSFYETVAAPVEGQELSHFFSQIPDDLKVFFQ